MRPFFSGRERAVGEAFPPVDLALAVELLQQPSPGLVERAIAGPLDEAAPDGGVRREPRRQVFPPRTTAEDPQDPFEAGPRVGHRTAALGARLGIGEQVSDQQPMFVAELGLQLFGVGLRPGPRVDAGSIRHQKSLLSETPTAASYMGFS